MSKKEEMWKQSISMMKNLKQILDSDFRFSTALCMEAAPSYPLRARPGPNITQKVEMVMQRRPQDIASVVVAR